MPILFRGTAGLNGTLQCYPEEAQAFVHESLPTKDICISKSPDSVLYGFG